MEERESPYVETMELMEEAPSQAYYVAALATVGLSALLFLTGRRSLANFVGLWPPTILALGLFYKLLHPSREQVLPQMRKAAEELRRVA